MNSYYLPCYTIGTDAFENFESVMSFYGRKVALLYGEKAFKASKDKVLPALKNFDIIYQTVYGKEASYANIDRLAAVEQISRADLILAVGGGKCLDVAKVVGDKLGKPVFTVASIASTCAAVTRIAVLHNDDGSFREVYRLTNPPVHCFIDPEIIVNAPARYFWAGMGDTMAKHVECVFSSKNDVLDFESALGRTISVLCYDPILEKGEKAYDDVKNHVVSGEVDLQGSCACLPYVASEPLVVAQGRVSVRNVYLGNGARCAAPCVEAVHCQAGAVKQLQPPVDCHVFVQDEVVEDGHRAVDSQRSRGRSALKPRVVGQLLAVVRDVDCDRSRHRNG